MQNPFRAMFRHKKRVSFRRRIVGLVVLFFLALLIIPLVGGQLGRYKVISRSMFPALHRGDFVLVDQRANYLPQRGDIIVFEDPEHYVVSSTRVVSSARNELVTKRLIGLPGEHIEVTPEDVVINGRHFVVNDWRGSVTPKGPFSTTLGEDEIFVMGDNRSNSYDSLFFGPVRLDRVYGRIFMIYWPPSRFGLLEPVRAIQAREVKAAAGSAPVESAP